MPELPEVETVKRSLLLRLKEKKISDVKIYYDNIIEYPSVGEFVSNIVGQCINNVERYGKWLIFVLDDYYFLTSIYLSSIPSSNTKTTCSCLFNSTLLSLKKYLPSILRWLSK